MSSFPQNSFAALPPSSSTRRRQSYTKVAILGASGGIGQPLSLLCKLNSKIDELSLYDLVGTPGIAADLSHIPSSTKVLGKIGKSDSPPSDNNDLKEVLTGATLVVILSGLPRKEGMSRDDLFEVNASILSNLVEGCALFCPRAFIAVVTNPINSMVPVAAEVMKKYGVYDKRKLVGVTSLDVSRASTFLRDVMMENEEMMKLRAQSIGPVLTVDVIGGHSGTTIVPLFSRVFENDDVCFSMKVLRDMTVRTQFGGDEIVKKKDGKGSATLSMAWATYKFIENTLLALSGDSKDIIQCAFVESNLTSSPFFSSPCRFGLNGVEDILPLGKLSAYETDQLEKMLPMLSAQILKGVKFGRKNDFRSKL